MSKLAAYLDPKFFRGTKKQEDILEMLYAQKAAKKENYIPLAQIRGHVTGIEMMKPQESGDFAGKEPNVKLVGTIEGLCYETGELKEAAGAFLPGYFRKLLETQIKQQEGGVLFHIEVGVELTGRNIPWAWVVVNKMPPDTESKFGKLQAASGPMTTPKLISSK